MKHTYENLTNGNLLVKLIIYPQEVLTQKCLKQKSIVVGWGQGLRVECPLYLCAALGSSMQKCEVMIFHAQVM